MDMVDVNKLLNKEQLEWAVAASRAYGDPEKQKLTMNFIQSEMTMIVGLSKELDKNFSSIATPFAKTDPNYQIGFAQDVREAATVEIKKALDVAEVREATENYAGFLQIANAAKTMGGQPSNLSRASGLQKRADTLEKVEEFLGNLSLMKVELEAAKEKGELDPSLQKDVTAALGFLEKNWIPKVTALQESLKTDVTKIIYKGRNV